MSQDDPQSVPKADLSSVLKTVGINNPFELIGHPDKIRNFRNQAVLKVHPDKHPGEDRRLWGHLFDKVNSILAILKDPTSTIDRSPSSYRWKHKYSVSRKEGDIEYTKEHEQNYSIHLPTIQSPIVQEFLKVIWQLSNEDLQALDQRFEKLLGEFTKQIVSMHEATPFDRIFSSSKQIDADLKSLINYQQDAHFIQKINALKTKQPKYETFSIDLDEHVRLFYAFCPYYFNKTEFRENLFKIYLKLASEQKQQQAYAWVYDRRSYANATAWLLKVPVFLIYLALFLSLIMFIMLPLILLVLIIDTYPLISLATAAIAFLGWFAVAGISLVIGRCFNISPIGAPIDFLDNTAAFVAICIDRFIETLFNAKLHATELAGILFQIQGHSPREKNLAQVAQYLPRFGFYTRQQEPEEKSTPEEDLNP